jgi:small subunit ribosomal protein S5
MKHSCFNSKKINFTTKILQISQITKVTTGGKKITVRATIIVGDKKQIIGLGVGHGEDISLAIQKAIIQAKKNLIFVPITKYLSLPHIIKVSYGAEKIILRPGFSGTGILAETSIKKILSLGGIKNIFVKQLGANNILNNAKAIILAISLLNKKIRLRRVRLKKNNFFYNRILKYDNFLI